MIDVLYICIYNQSSLIKHIKDRSISMRLRNIKGAREAIANDKYVINEPEKLKGNWKSLFEGDNPIHLEIAQEKVNFLQI